MTIRFLPVCGMVLATSGLLAAQQSKLSGPVAGFVFDGPGHAVRPIQGVPGASLLGDPVNFGFDLTAAYVSPRQDSAFVVGADQSLHLFRIDSGTVTEIGLGGLSGPPQSVVFSPSGTAAALFALGKARVLTGLPDNPKLVATVSIPSGQVEAAPRGASRTRPVRAPGEALAISDDGAYLLSVSGGSARLLSIHGQNRALLPSQSDALVAFAAGGHDAAIMDSVAGLTLIRDAAGAAVTQVLAAPDDGLASPVGLAFSQDHLTLYVASGAAHSVSAFNLSAGSRTAIGCDCTPATLVPLGNSFRLNDVSPSPLWLLDSGNSTPRTVFVPARAE
jgi:hypothetical protein